MGIVRCPSNKLVVSLKYVMSELKNLSNEQVEVSHDAGRVFTFTHMPSTRIESEYSNVKGGTITHESHITSDLSDFVA